MISISYDVNDHASSKSKPIQLRTDLAKVEDRRIYTDIDLDFWVIDVITE